jgi:hypothetical protein
MVQTGVLMSADQVEAVPEGQLLAALAQQGILTPEKLHSFMLGLVRDRVLAMVTQSEGGYRFLEERAFLDVAPLFRINPFGLILESRRRSVTPDRLMLLGKEYEDKKLFPGPALAAAAHKLRDFLRGVDVTTLIDGSNTAHNFWQLTGLDDIMGTLVLLTLLDARLVFVEEGDSVRADVQLSENVGGSGGGEASLPSAEEFSGDAGAAEIISLYQSLESVVDPHGILGVAPGAAAEVVDNAYLARLEALNPDRIPEAPAKGRLVACMEEVRAKVTEAYKTLRG